MRLAALRAGALPPRGANDGAPVDVLPNGPEVMRSPDGIFGNSGLSESASAAKQILDSAMTKAPDRTLPVLAPDAPAVARSGMMFRGVRPGPAQPSGMVPNDPSTGGTGIAALDNAPALNLTPETTIADGEKGGVNDTIHPSFFQHGGLGQKLAGIAGNMMVDMAAGMGNPVSMLAVQQRAADHNAQRQFAVWQAQEASRREQQLEDRDYEDNQKPRYFAGNEDYRRYDPSTDQVDTLFDAPRPEQEYASHFGQPGSPEYQTAMQDYVLKGWGSTAMDARTQLNSDRFQQRLTLKQTPTYSNLHPRQPAPHAARPPNTSNVVAGILQKGASGQPLNPQEQQIFSSYVNGRRGGGHGSGGTPGAITEGTIIKNPQTGARMKMSGGKWVAL